MHEVTKSWTRLSDFTSLHFIHIYIHIDTHIYTTHIHGLPGGPDGKESICLCRRPRFDPWLGISPEKEMETLQNSCLENPMHRGPAAAAAAKSLQSCATLCDPIDGSPPGSTIPGILQARTLEWIAISFSNA